MTHACMTTVSAKVVVSSTTAPKGVVRVRSAGLASELPVEEQWLWRNKEALKAVMRGIRQAEAGQTAYVGSFSEFADDEID